MKGVCSKILSNPIFSNDLLSDMHTSQFALGRSSLPNINISGTTENSMVAIGDSRLTINNAVLGALIRLEIRKVMCNSLAWGTREHLAI